MKTLLETASIFTTKKDVRVYLRFIHSSGKTLDASDGHICIRFETDKYPEGYYLPEGYKVILEDQYPNIDRVMEHFANQSDAICIKDGKPGETGGTKYLQYTGRYYDSHFDVEYIKKIKRLGKNVETFVVNKQTSFGNWQVMLFSGVFVEDDVEIPFKGVLMPMRV